VDAKPGGPSRRHTDEERIVATGAYAVSSTPDRDEVVTLAGGRRVAVAIWGTEGGPPVVLCHGNPGSRLLCPDLATTRARSVQLIAVDRPGIGRSDPRPGFTLRDTAADLVAVLDALHLDACTVVGWSAGAHQALALGALHPDRVERVVLACGPGTADDPALLAQRTEAAARVIAAVRAGTADALIEVVDRFRGLAEDPASILRRTLADDTDPDRRLMQDPAVARFLVAMWAEGVQQGPSALAEMWAAQYARDWGFRPEDLTVPVDVWHGTEDRVCPVAQAQRLAARIPDATVHLLEGKGHLVPIEHWDEMLGALAADRH
jgi:pimeloyl-ACP methyl ester carboxylesterase